MRKRKKHSNYISKIKSRSNLSSLKGYSFIELLIVFSIMGIVGVIGMASFVSFNNSQAVEGSASDVANSLTVARQRALSQIKPTNCTNSRVLNGYRVMLNITARTYRVDALCGTLVVPVSTKTLPAQVTFDATSATTIVFTVPQGTVANPGTITIRGFGKTKQIIVDGTGTIRQP